MLVYVVTRKQLENAFNDWIEKGNSDDRTIIYKVFSTFMASADARIFHTVTGLISFSLDQWKSQFDGWINQEIQRVPKSKKNIQKWSDQLIDHLESPWCFENKLIVTECLEDTDVK